jgi:hypothetical protein
MEAGSTGHAGYSYRDHSRSSPIGAEIFDRTLTSRDLGGHPVVALRPWQIASAGENYLGLEGE